jgi:hypothetical protein
VAIEKGRLQSLPQMPARVSFFGSDDCGRVAGLAAIADRIALQGKNKSSGSPFDLSHASSAEGRMGSPMLETAKDDNERIQASAGAAPRRRRSARLCGG